MTDSQNMLINLLRKSLFDFNFEIPESVDWNCVYEEAAYQSVVAMAFDGTSGISDIPAEVYKNFKDYTISVFLKNDSVLNEQKSLIKLLESNDVKYAVLKGTSAARLYNKPELRTLGDIDILVKKSDFESTKSLLMLNEYRLIDDGFNHFHCEFERNGVVVELHHEISEFPNTKLCDELRAELQKAVDSTVKADKSELGYEYSILSPLYQAVSLLLHMERHISKDGLGLRQLLDWGEFLRKNSEFLSEEKNISFLKKYGLYKFAVIGENIIKKYFYQQKVKDDIADSVFELAVKKGNFGVKRSDEESYSNGIVRIGSKNPIVRYYNYSKARAEITWDFAKSHPTFAGLGCIYLPIRYCFRRIVGKKEKVDFTKVTTSANEISTVYDKLEIYKGKV